MWRRDVIWFERHVVKTLVALLGGPLHSPPLTRAQVIFRLKWLRQWSSTERLSSFGVHVDGPIASFSFQFKKSAKNLFPCHLKLYTSGNPKFSIFWTCTVTFDLFLIRSHLHFKPKFAKFKCLSNSANQKCATLQTFNCRLFHPSFHFLLSFLEWLEHAWCKFLLKK